MGLPTPPRKPLWPACPGDPLPIWQFYLIYGCLFRAALSVFCSGYTWLVARPGGLFICTTANQNTPPGVPLLVLDVWEHAYYLKHYNLRADYIKDWFRILNWERAEMNFLDFLSACPSSF
jgi:hypothetical protein